MSNSVVDKEVWKSLSAKNVALPEEIEKDDEVWIFEVPADYDISSLDGKKITFVDGQIIDRSTGLFAKQLLVDDFSTAQNKTERIVMPDSAKEDKWKYVAPKGRISIIDYLDADHIMDDQVPQTQIARCPKLPVGLKKRYKPFGVPSGPVKIGRHHKEEFVSLVKHKTPVHTYGAKSSKH